MIPWNMLYLDIDILGSTWLRYPMIPWSMLYLDIEYSRFHLTPLSYDTLEYAAGFSSEQCPEGVVAISTNTLR